MMLILVRHGQTALNAAKVYQGQGVDEDLDETGIWQAQRLAQRLRDNEIHAAYSSDLKRSLNTASFIASLHNPPLKVEPLVELRERNLGAYEGTSYGDADQYTRDFKASGCSFGDFCPPGGGESWGALQERMIRLLTKLHEKYDEETVMLVGHGGALSMLILYATGEHLDRENQKAYHMPNASLAFLYWLGHGRRNSANLVSVPRIDHLAKDYVG